MTDAEWAIFYNTMMSSEDMLQTFVAYSVLTPVYPEEMEEA
jgi:hypothetical protein